MEVSLHWGVGAPRTHRRSLSLPRSSPTPALPPRGALTPSHPSHPRPPPGRTVLFVLLRWRRDPQSQLLVASTHLERNPEDRAKTWTRSRQYVQVLYNRRSREALLAGSYGRRASHSARACASPWLHMPRVPCLPRSPRARPRALYLAHSLSVELPTCGASSSQLFREMRAFASEHDAMDAPVVLSGDLNAKDINELAQMTQTLLAFSQTPAHPLLWSVARRALPPAPTMRYVTICRPTSVLIADCSHMRPCIRARFARPSSRAQRSLQPNRIFRFQRQQEHSGRAEPSHNHHRSAHHAHRLRAFHGPRAGLSCANPPYRTTVVTACQPLCGSA